MDDITQKGTKEIMDNDGVIPEIKKSRGELVKRGRDRTTELEESKIALLNILEDVENARKKAREETNKTLAIITNFSDGLLVFDKEDKLSLINPKAGKIFGIEEKEILDKKISDFSQTPSLFSLASLFQGELKEIFRKEMVLGETVLEISAAPVIREQEKTGFLIIIHDITREKKIETMKSEFVSISAHQLRTPLSAIKWTLRMLLDGDAGALLPPQKDLLEKTYVSNERMIVLINDLLDVTRIEEGRSAYRFAPSDVGLMVQSLAESYRGIASRKKISIEFKKTAGKVPKIMLDVEKIKLAIQNVVENSIRYTLPGGKVTIAVKYDKEEVEVSVQDTGVGI